MSAKGELSEGQIILQSHAVRVVGLAAAQVHLQAQFWRKGASDIRGGQSQGPNALPASRLG